MERLTIVAATLAVGLAGCSGVPGSTSSQLQRAPQAVFAQKLQAAEKAHQLKISPTAKAYLIDTIGVQDGSEVAEFPSSATITRNASGMAVFDPLSGQTFKFSPNAVVHTEIGSGRVYVEPNEQMPSWARAANARPVSTVVQ